MGEKLTKRDVEKIEEEIEHRKLVIRKEESRRSKRPVRRATSVKTLNIMQQRNTKTRMKAASVIWREC